jgi:hypothetical protein
MPKKYFTFNEVLIKYNKLSSSKQVTILWDALDYMQQYNGRTKSECVILAMGFEGEFDKYIKTSEE